MTILGASFTFKLYDHKYHLQTLSSFPNWNSVPFKQLPFLQPLVTAFFLCEFDFSRYFI
jgi:hypothetical protein